MRTLFGPCDLTAAATPPHPTHEPDSCQLFGPGTGLEWQPADSWNEWLARLPTGWRPDLIALWLPYGRIPEGVWQVPVPVIGLAADWNLLWHSYRCHLLPRCDWVLTDESGVRQLRRAGLTHVGQANLFGLGQPWFDLTEPLPPDRDIDVLFIGNLHPAVQRERLPWLGRLAGLATCYRVEVRASVFGAEYRSLMRRAKIVFNRSIRGECNMRALEAVAAGALLFQEADNREVPRYLRPGSEYVAYRDDNLEALLEHYLTDDALRTRIAATARQRLGGLSFDALWAEVLQGLEPTWAQIQARAARRRASPPVVSTVACAWGLMGGGTASAVRLAADDVEAANAAGVVAASPTAALDCFTRALEMDPGHLVAGLNRSEALAQLGQRAAAAVQARLTLTELERVGGLSEASRDAPPYPRGYSLLRVEWERAAWEHAGDQAAELAAKADLVRWRLHTLLAETTEELSHYHEAAQCRPDVSSTRAALGCALARSGRVPQAIPHLRVAVALNPFDLAAARALAHALTELGDRPGARRFARARQLLSRVAPDQVPLEEWFATESPTGDELASIIVPCWNNLELTQGCLESVLRHTRKPYELVLVDNGSSDGTPAYFEELKARSGPTRVVVIRNDENRGFPPAINQGLSAAQGAYLVLLNNDTVVTPGWLDGLVDWALTDYPQVGLVGAVTNASRPPQEIEPGYTDLADLDAFARRRARDYAGQALGTERLTGFCLLLRRDVYEKLGGLDESYGLGFFDDDDLSVRALEAGYRLLVALGVYIHHHGSRTFKTLDIDPRVLLRDNFERFRAKWGERHAAGYRLPSMPVPASAAETIAVPSAQGQRPKVSLCMMVKDEEHNLPACLDGVRGLVDELVVVDTGSTDRTKAVAAVLGARVVDFPWCDSFAAARNESLRHATGEWIFWLDADDRLDPKNRQQLQTLFGTLNGDNAAYVMKCRCVPSEPGGAATVVDHVRLFRNLPEHRWRYRVHEQILPALRATGSTVRWSEVVIEHVGYTDPALRKCKLERDQRLLTIELAEQPEDPFTLFNLGSVYQELGLCAEAITYLRRSLARSEVRDSIVRKLYALIAQCHRQLGQSAKALSACAEGRRHYPDDAELLFIEALARRETGDRSGAEACLERLIEGQDTEHFASVDAGLRGHKARHNLAVLHLERGRRHEAEALWRAALVEEPHFLPAHLSLGELYLRYQDWAALERSCADLERLDGHGPAEAAALRGRARLERGELAQARWLLAEAVSRFPGHVGLRVLLSHALLKEGTDPAAAEKALRDVLELDPGNREAEHNLAVLRASIGTPVTLERLYREACERPSDINEHLPTLYELAQGCRHVTEFGTRGAVSTTALLYAQPEELVCYDLVRLAPVDRLERLAGQTRFRFVRQDVREAQIAATDLLFIDTWHVYGQLQAELARHAAKARRYIVLHDTETYRDQGESDGHRGLWPAVAEFLAKGEFVVKDHYANNNGLTVLERVRG